MIELLQAKAPSPPATHPDYGLLTTPSLPRARDEVHAENSQDTSIVETADNKGDRLDRPTDRPSDGWLTTGEAYHVAQSRGLTLEETTFRNLIGKWRNSKPRQMPRQLEGLGIQEDFDSCPNARAKTNRWLRFE